MKNVKLMISLFVLITLFATASMAITGQELADSPLTPEQKNQVITKIIEKDGTEAQSLFDKLMEEAAITEAIAFQKQFQSEMKAKADANLSTAQAKITKKLNTDFTPKPIDQVWSIATAYIDTTTMYYPGTVEEYQQFVAEFMTKRYGLKGKFNTIDSVEIAYNQRSAELKAELAHEAKTKAIVTNTLLPLTTKMGKMEIKIGILEQSDKNMKADLASMTRAQKDDNVNLDALIESIIDDDIKKAKFESILQKEDKTKEVTQ